MSISTDRRPLSVPVDIAGGSVALGRRLAGHLGERGADVTVLSRRPKTDAAHRQVPWDGRTVGDWAELLGGALVINLAGALVDRRPTPSNVDLLRSSRVEPTQTLVAASHRVATPPRLWLQMSTLAIYGDAGETVLDEDAPPADGPEQMAGVARAWESALAGVRVERSVILRTGIVLDRHTPALDRLTGLVRWGLGGRVGTGRQWTSWIHIDDFLAAVDLLIDERTASGIVHVTAPNPIRNAEMMAELRRNLRRPWAPPTPAPLVRLGARVLRTDPALALTGRRCVPERLQGWGLRFRHPTFGDAIGDLLSSS